MFKPLDAGDKKYKPLILEWLSRKYSWKKYEHDYSDQWILWTIWEGSLSITFDFRQKKQQELFDKIPQRFKGTKQKGTGKLVNKHSLYFTIDDICSVKIPTITRKRLIRETKHKDDDGDRFYTYDWEIFLSDGTSIAFHNQNQNPEKDLVQYTLRSYIEQRSFLNLLDNLK